MRKSNPVRFGELWEGFVEGTPAVKRRLAEARVAELWPDIVGPAIAAHTVSVKVDKGVLEVEMSSSVARHELFMRRAALADAANKAVGVKVVNMVRLK